MPIRRHGNGWEVRIQHGGRRYSKTVATRTDAQYLEARLRQRVNDTRAGRVSSHTLEEALERWLREEFPRLKSKQSHRSLVKAILPALSGKQLGQVVEVADAIRDRGLGAGLEPAPINRRLALLKRIAKLAYRRWHWLENDLGAKIELLPGEVRRSEWVTHAEAKRLMAAAAGPIREAIRWALLTGLRRGELLSLTPAHFRGRVIHLTETKSGKPRSVPLASELDPKRFPYGLHPTYLSKGFQNARRLAQLPHIRFHDLRRSFGTWLVQKRTDAAVVRDLLGHSTLTMTSRYLGTDMAQLAKAMKTLPSLGLSRGKKTVSHRVKRA
jgi:integrase